MKVSSRHMVFLQVDAGYSRLPKRGRGCHGGRGFAAATKESRVRRSSDRVRRNSVRVRRSSDRMRRSSVRVRRSTDSKSRVRFPSRHPFGVHCSESYR
jgi:hypothetical protein